MGSFGEIDESGSESVWSQGTSSEAAASLWSQGTGEGPGDARERRRARQADRREGLIEALGHDPRNAEARAERQKQRALDKLPVEERERAGLLAPKAERTLASFSPHAAFANEHKQYFKGFDTTDPAYHERTKFYDDAELEAHKVGAKRGLLTNADGSLMDTTGAKATNRVGSNEGKNIFALLASQEDGSRGVYAADAMGEHEDSRRRANRARIDDPAATKIVEHTHHSSFASGGAVQGAGELAVKEGWVKEVSNESGHYEPGMASTVQTLDTLENMGANLDATKVAHVSKDGATQKVTEELFQARAVSASRGNLDLMRTHKAMFAAIRDGRAEPYQNLLLRASDEEDSTGAYGAAGPTTPGIAARELERLMPARTSSSAQAQAQVPAETAPGRDTFAAWQAATAARLERGDELEAERLPPPIEQANVTEDAGPIEQPKTIEQPNAFDDLKALVQQVGNGAGSDTHAGANGAANGYTNGYTNAYTNGYTNRYSGGGTGNYGGGSGYTGSDVSMPSSDFIDLDIDDDSDDDAEEIVDPVAEARRVARARLTNTPDAHRGGWNKFGNRWVEADGKNSRLEAREQGALVDEHGAAAKEELVLAADRLRWAEANNPALVNDAQWTVSQLEADATRLHGRELGQKREFGRHKDYALEDQDYFNKQLGPGFNEYTHMYDADERKAHELGARDGLLTGAGGQLLDTSSAARTSLDASTAGRYIFGLDHDMIQGQKLYAADAAAENAALLDKGLRTRKVGHVHHSSFVNGSSLNGAGEFAAREGWLRTVSNVSGHHRPDMDGQVQTLDALEKMGVNTDATKVEHHALKQDGTVKATDYMARAVAATRGDRGLMDAHKLAFEGIKGTAGKPLSRVFDDLGPRGGKKSAGELKPTAASEVFENYAQ